MKIIGLLSAWACEDWIDLAITQALDLVDELIISIGYYHKFFKAIEDKTINKVKKHLNNEKIKIVETYCDKNNSKVENRRRTLNLMLEASDNIEVGNIIWLFDADEFYSKEAIEEIMNFIKKEDFDVIIVKDYMFCINFDYYIILYHERIFKITNKNFYFFKPTQIFWPPPKKKAILLENNPMFHYSLLLGEQIKGIQWILEGLPLSVLWYRKIYRNYDPSNEDFWMKKNQELIGNYRFWKDTRGKVIEKNCHGLFRYNGKQSGLIEKSALRKIIDFRSYTKKKPNYKRYLEIAKPMIKNSKKNTWKMLFFKIIESKIWQKTITNLNKSLLKKPFYKNIFKKFFMVKLNQFEINIKSSYK